MNYMRAQQGTRRTPARYQFITEDEMLNEGEYDDAEPRRMPSSTRRYQALADVRTEVGRSADAQVSSGRRSYPHPTGESELRTIPPRRTAAATQGRIPIAQATASRVYIDEESITRTTGAYHPRKAWRGGQKRFHWLFFAGLALLAMILGWVALSTLGSWVQNIKNDVQYGYPRTFQTNAVVGHNDSPQNPSHFIAMNLQGHVIVIEIPGGNVSKSVVYSGPTLLGPDRDQTPVTLTFQDVNHDGKPDMIINVQGSQFVFLNEHGTFVPAPQNQNSSG